MKVAVAYDHLDIRIEEHPEPEALPGTLLVDMHACGVCTTDVLAWYVRSKAPVVLGHEAVGTVRAVGDGAEGFAPGDRIFYHHHAPCLTCPFCLKKQFTLCPQWKKNSVFPGGLSQVVRVDAASVKCDTLKIPPGMSWEEAVFIEPLACSLRMAKKARAKPGDRAVQIGLGVMGLVNCFALMAYGVKDIVALDLTPIRIQWGKELGIPHVLDASEPGVVEKVNSLTGGGADIVVVGPHTVEAMETGLALVGKGGTVLLYTPADPGEILPVNPSRLYFDDLTLTCSYSCDPEDTREALWLIQKGVLPVERLITHRFPFDRTQEAFTTLAAGGEVLKVIVYADDERFRVQS